MNEKVNNDYKYRCKLCNKNQSSASSLCNHNKKFHIPNVSNNIPNVSNNIPVINNKNTCKHCYKLYSSPQNRWKHEQKCKENKINDDKLKILENTISQLQQQIQNIVNEKGKVHHKTLQKINKQVTNTINNTNNNNGTIIHNTFVKFSDVSYDKIFNEKQLLSILHP